MRLHNPQKHSKQPIPNLSNCLYKTVLHYLILYMILSILCILDQLTANILLYRVIFDAALHSGIFTIALYINKLYILWQI